MGKVDTGAHPLLFLSLLYEAGTAEIRVVSSLIRTADTQLCSILMTTLIFPTTV